MPKPKHYVYINAHSLNINIQTRSRTVKSMLGRSGLKYNLKPKRRKKVNFHFSEIFYFHISVFCEMQVYYLPDSMET
jgi:hypothetical protein